MKTQQMLRKTKRLKQEHAKNQFQKNHLSELTNRLWESLVLLLELKWNQMGRFVKQLEIN
jgi:hypothetical protein